MIISIHNSQNSLQATAKLEKDKITKTRDGSIDTCGMVWHKLFIYQVTVQLQKRRQVKGLAAMLMPAKHAPHVI